MGNHESYFITKLNDRSFKIRELHFTKKFRLEYVKAYNKFFIYKIKAYLNIILDEYFFKKYDRIIVLAEEEVKNWKNKKVIVIPNSIPEELKEKSNLKNKKVISVGRLEAQKSYEDLIEIWEKVVAKFPEWKLEIWGDGPDREKLSRIIEEKKMKNNLFVRGVTKNIEEEYKKSSIFVLTSKYEGMPMVILEAMSYGIPVISFACPTGPKDIILDKQDGYLIEGRDKDKFVERLSELIVNEELRVKMGGRAQENIKRYSESKVMENWKKFFEKNINQ